MAENWNALLEIMAKEMSKLNEKIDGLGKKNAAKNGNGKLKKQKGKMEKKFPSRRVALPAELLNELFASLPFESASGILAKMPNALLARNVRKMLKSFKMAMKSNKWNVANSGSKLEISQDGLEIKHSGPTGFNWAFAILPVPKFNLAPKNSSIAIYYEVEIIQKHRSWNGCISIGFSTQNPPFSLDNEFLGFGKNITINFWRKMGIYINRIFIKFGEAPGYFQAGDVIGIGIVHPSANLPIFKCFGTFNGKLLGIANLPLGFTISQLFPTVSLYVEGDTVRTNFGDKEWRFNPRQILKELK